jgi:hypothetical protein
MQFCHKNIPSNKNKRKKPVNAAFWMRAARFAKSLLIVGVNGTIGGVLRSTRRIEPN